jgi:acyl carrier protein
MDSEKSDPRASHILDIVAKETFVDRAKLLPEARIDELGIASIDIVQTIFAIESEFDIELPVAGAGAGAEFETVQALVDHVLATLDQAAAISSAGTEAEREPELVHAIARVRER